jgi:hypothetical protein
VSVIGVDPGGTGALAHYDIASNTLDVEDMPVWSMAIGKGKTRKRIDGVALLEYFEMKKMMGVQLVMIEAVGGRPKQSASNAFVFGYGVGLIYMACVATRLPIETVPPQTWKKLMRVPGKGKKQAEKENRTPKQTEGMIVQRADELFPAYSGLWRGPRGGYRLDRAEAAILARYAGDYAMRSTRPVRIQDAEWQMVYRGADTGA